MSISDQEIKIVAVEITVNAPRPGMSGRELDQWNQRMYDALVALAEQGGVTVISDHNDLANNGGDNSHASIANHINSDRAHGTTSDVVGEDDAQTLTSKTIDAEDNTILNLKHGTEVDNPTAAHGVGTVAGLTEQQRFENKTELEPYKIITTNYLLLATDKAIKAMASVQITLISAVGIKGQIFRLYNASAGNVTTTPHPGQKIEDEVAQRIPKNSCMVIQSDGANWRIT